MSNITTDFVATTKKIVVEVRSILTALHLIREDVKVIRDQVVSEANKQKPYQQTDQSDTEHSNGAASRGKVLNVNDAHGKKENGSKKTRAWYQDFKTNAFKAARKPRFFVELIALLGLGLYTCETHRTNNLTEESERPWMGAAGMNVKDFEASKVPAYAITWINSGRSPAKVTFTGSNCKAYAIFPKEPEYTFDTVPSTSVVVPGQPLQSARNGKITDSDSAQLETETFYVYGDIEYFDIRTTKTYWTHVCYRYIPKMSKVANNGFLSCPEYNDAK
ncbi:MAG TPA: hypothetical protein VE957_18190 [Terriglobales bacterium]|nr:hypothetical protein [Terriglobales bacterium]